MTISNISRLLYLSSIPAKITKPKSSSSCNCKYYHLCYNLNLSNLLHAVVDIEAISHPNRISLLHQHEDCKLKVYWTQNQSRTKYGTKSSECQNPFWRSQLARWGTPRLVIRKIMTSHPSLKLADMTSVKMRRVRLLKIRGNQDLYLSDGNLKRAGKEVFQNLWWKI